MKPNWIINSLGELGVEIDGKFFFLYKGESLEYTNQPDVQGMQFRPVGKREFGEVCRPDGFDVADHDNWSALPLPEYVEK